MSDEFATPKAEIVGFQQGAFAAYEIPFRTYPSGEPLVNDKEVWHNPPAMLLVRQQSMTAFLAAMFLVDAWRERGHAPPALFLPQVPGARQDRLNDSGDYLFTAKSIAQMINARQFPRVTVFDPHSEVIAGLIERCHVLHADFFVGAWDGWPNQYKGIISPDAGAEKRASRMAKTNGLPLFHAWKSRDVTTGTISGFGVQPLEPGHYLVVDDLCDAGGTFIGLAGELAKLGCTADLYVSHGLFTKGVQPLLDCYKRVITTDSTIGDKGDAYVITVCRAYLEESCSPS
jgi:ribose-phosphate pyrophosphokinase